MTARQADPSFGGESFDYDKPTGAGVPAPTLVTQAQLTAALSQVSGAGAGNYVTPRPWLTTPAGWDTAWQAAKAAAKTTPAVLAAIGDSITAAQNSGDVMNNNWVELLANDLAVSANGGRYADFYPLWTYSSRFNSSMIGTAPYTDPGGGSSWEGGYGRAVELGTGQNTTFTPPRNTAVVGFDLIYVDAFVGSFTYSVDGGSAQTVTTTLSSYTSSLIKKVSITGLTAGAHTITINGASGHACVLVGVAVYYSGGTGIGITRSAYNGGRAVDLATPGGLNLGAGGVPSAPNNKLLAWAGTTAGGSASVAYDGFPGQPSLAIIGLVVNDCVYGSALATYKTTLQRLIRALRRGTADCSILFLMPSFPDSIYSDAGVSGNGIYYHRWKSVVADVARTFTCAVADIDGKWLSRGVALGFQGTADIHPNASGYADIYNTIKGAIL